MGESEAAVLRTAAPLFADLSDGVLEHVWQAGTTLPPLVAGEPLPQGEGDEATFTIVLRGVLERASTGVRLPAGQATGVANLVRLKKAAHTAWRMEAYRDASRLPVPHFVGCSCWQATRHSQPGSPRGPMAPLCGRLPRTRLHGSVPATAS